MKHAIISEVFDQPETLLNRTVDLKREGYAEEDMYVLVKRADVADVVRRQSKLYVLVTDEPGTVASLVTSSERPIERWIGSMRLTKEQQDRFTQVDRPKMKLEPETEEQTLALHEERLTVEKQAVQTGEVVINRYITETNQEIEVPVLREQVHVERKVGSEDVLEDYDFNRSGFRTIDEGDHLRIQVIEERAFVVKRPVVVEEIIVRKRVTEEIETLTETLRKEELKVREVGQADVTIDNQTTRKDEER